MPTARGRFTADASVFYYDYSDLQVSALTPIGQATTNAASAEIYGLELQLDARLDAKDRHDFRGAASPCAVQQLPQRDLHQFHSGAGLPYAPITCDVTGNRLPFAPKFKFNVGASHQVSLGRSGTLLLSGNLAYNSGYFAEPDNVVRQDAFTTVDVSAEWRPGCAGLSVRLWALNLTDAHYYNAPGDRADARAFFKIRRRPARFGASIGYAF